MNGDPTLVESFTSSLQFLGKAIFTWVPNVLNSVAQSVNSPEATTTPILGTLAQPLSAPDFSAFLERASSPGVYDSLAYGWYVFVLLSFALSIPFLAVIVYCTVRVFLIRRHEKNMLLASQNPIIEKDVPKSQLRWGKIIEQARGGSEHGWRLAILEADIMLSSLLDLQGYKGETMAEKMKQVDRADFNSIDGAWEAHKVRNRIAHEGDAHSLSQREVRRIIGLYERVFKEFNYI